MSELTRRVLFALVAAPVFLYTAFLGGLPFIILMWVICMLIQRELLLLIRQQGFRINPYLTHLSGTAVLSIALYPGLAGLILFGNLIVIIAADTLNKYERQQFSLFGTLFATFYPSAAILSFLLIRQSETSPEAGFMLILLLLLMIWGNDSFAYFGGKTFGRNLMAPHLSPKKTWEGFGSGILGAFIGLALVLYFIPTESFSYAQLIALPILISIFGPIGDLAVSKIKRASGAKDTSNLLPGHGGMLDRFDSILLAAPVFYIYISYFL